MKPLIIRLNIENHINSLMMHSNSKNRTNKQHNNIYYGMRMWSKCLAT